MANGKISWCDRCGKDVSNRTQGLVRLECNGRTKAGGVYGLDTW